MNRARILGWVLYCTLGFALSGSGADAPERPASVLEGAKELDKRVTYSETKIPLGELVQKVAQDTGVKLAATPDVADEPVAVVIKDFPAKELLEQLADLLDYRWSRRGSGVQAFRRSGAQESSPAPNLNARTPERLNASLPAFEIYQDLAGKQREEALRQSYLAGVEKEFREEVERYVQLAALSQEQIRAIYEAWDRRRQEMQKLSPEEQRARELSPEGQKLARRYFAAERLWSPINRVLAGMLGRLTAEQWAALREGDPLVFSTTPRPGELPMPEETVRQLREARPSRITPELHVFSNPPEIEEQMQRQEQLAEERWAAASGFRVELDPQPDLFRRIEARALIVRVTAVGGEGGQSGLSDGGPGAGLGLRAGPTASPGLAEADDPERRAALEADPVVGVKRRFQPETKSRQDPSDPRSRPWWRFWELAPELGRVFDVGFISDSYGRIVNGVTQPSSEPTALFVWLDRFARSENREWDRRGRLIRLRSRTWFFERPREIPLRLVRRWKAICGEQGALPLEEYVRMVATLTQQQLDGLTFLQSVEGLPPDMTFVLSAAGALRLYGALSPAQRQALWRGKALPVAQMTAAQRNLFAASVASARKDRHLRQPAPTVGEQESPGSFALSTERLALHITHRRGELTGYGIEDASVLGPGSQAAHGVAGRHLPAPTPGPAPPARRLAPDAPWVSWHAVIRVRFLLQIGSGVSLRPSVLIAPRR